MGWAAGGAGPGGLRGERQVGFLSSLFFTSIYFCFLFSVVCFDLVLDTKAFLLLLIIMVGTSRIIPKPFIKDQNYWTYIN